MYLLPMILSLLSIFSIATVWAPMPAVIVAGTSQTDPSLGKRRKQPSGCLNCCRSGDAISIW
jgi:hypothetical protein